MKTNWFDLSLAQRLSLGFGVLLGILVVLIAFVLERQSRSSEAQRTYVEDIAPRVELTRTLQDEVLRLAINVRSYLLTPDAERLTAYRNAADAVREAAARLVAARAEAGEPALFRPEVEMYVDIVERIVSTRSKAGGVTPDQELEMAQAREAAVAALGELRSRQREEKAAALAAMTAARENVQSVLFGSSAVMLVAFVGLAFATTRAVTVPVGDLVHVAGALERGDWQPALALAPQPGRDAGRRPRDEMRILGRAFGAAASALEHRAQRLKADREVAAGAASTLDRRELASRLLRPILRYLGCEIGVVYARRDDSDELVPIAQHALDEGLPSVRIGEGIPGQAAREERVLVVRDIPADTPFTVRLGYDLAPVRTVAAVPLRFGATVHGVAVVGSLRELDDEAIAFLESAGAQLGIGLQNANAHEHIARLLDELRERNQRLQAQNEEIQAQNEEIQAQNEELQAQAEELHAQQAEIERRNQQLEEQSLELRRHAAMLLDADQRKNEFLGLLAHELRNPLAPMTISLFLLKQSPPGSERATRAQAVIERQVEHLSRLTDDLLDVTRISRGKIQITRQPLDLVEVVRSCIEDQQSTIARKPLALDIYLPATAIWVDGDRTRLCQVINNLLSNASKFTDSGGRIGVRLAQDGEDAVLEVSDTGSGIDPRLMPQIFQPFTQGPVSLARTNGGLGLGLSLVKALVELHGGTVEARSDGPGRGSQFRVRLRGRTAPADPADPAGPGRSAPQPRARRVLLIEDNVDAAVSLKEALEIEGHCVEMAHSGRDGLDKARTFVPDVVLCDIGLPGLDGYEIARELRADSRMRGTLLVAVSGYAAEDDRLRAAEAGFDRHLGKPLTMERLSEVLADESMDRLHPGT